MAKVAVLRTTPETVLEDYGRLLRLAEYDKYLDRTRDTALKINISWQNYYPACSSTPWQIEGVIKTLLEDGFSRELIHACHNRTVVVNARQGEKANKHLPVVEKYNLRNVHLYDEGEEWVTYEPRGKMMVLRDIYPEGIQIPRRLIGENIIHLPTVKTHVFTRMTGAMKNAFGGLLHDKRHWTHAVIHETLVDLLTIQKEIHSGVFAVMDGTFIGDGPGPRCMDVRTGSFILASADQVAIDSVAARMMGFDPMDIKFIRLAHEAGLGVGNPSEIELVGDDITSVNFHCSTGQQTLASKGQHLIYWGPLKPLEKALLRSPLAPWSYLASRAYHDAYWYPIVGKPRVREAMETPWGQLFQTY